MNPDTTTPLFALRDLKTQFGKKIVHSDLNLDIFQGECLALIGGSGCGKSVLLRTLIGLERPKEGSLHFQGVNLFELDESSWVPYRLKIAYAFQWGALFDSLTVEENLAYPLREHTSLTDEEIREKVKRTLKEFNLENTDQLLPGSLSGGMQKRVGLARAIMLDPEVVLYDEPTAGLDPSNTRKINEMILKLKDMGKTSVLVTHDMTSALRVSDRVAYLLNGKISEVQTSAEARRQSTPLLSAFIKGEDHQ